MATPPSVTSDHSELPRGSLRTVLRSACGIAVAAAFSVAAGFALADSREDAESRPRAAAMEEERVVVEGTRPEMQRRAYSFVSALTHGGYAAESLARWQKPICALVAGIPAEQGQFILERVSQAATTAGAPLASTKCRPNLFIVVTSEPDRLLVLWRKRDHRLFGGAQRAAMRRVLNTPRPIRVWYKTEDACAAVAQGVPMGPDSNFEMLGRMPGCDMKNTRLEFNYVNVLSSVIVIVDTYHTKDIRLGPLADYIAMVGLAKLDLDANVGDAPTVLRLFADSADSADIEPQRMSAWDRAFLKGLYDSSHRSRFQRSAIAERMMRDLSR